MLFSIPGKVSTTMCATREQTKGSERHNHKAGDVYPPSPPTTSSFMTPISIRKHHDRNIPPTPASNNVFEYDTPQTASQLELPVPAPIQKHARRPSVVISDDGLDEEHYHLDNNSDHGAVENTGNFCAQMILLPTICQGDQLDIFMACRHPLDLLGMASPQDDSGGDVSEYHASSNSGSHRVSGYHAIPTSCEYCDSPDITKCPDDCQRPRSFFPKKRPPFCPKGGSEWGTMDFFIDTEDKVVSVKEDANAKSEATGPKWTLWDDIRR